MKLVLALAALWLAPAPAQAAACWLEQGVVVVPASVAGVAGDYILDTGSPATQLHETRAQMAGLPSAFAGDVRVDGLRLTDRPVVVVDLDARTYAFPTPIAGVIGADVLSAYVVDVAFAPCRVDIWPVGRAPRFHADARLAMRLTGGRPIVTAAVADGPRTALGGFVIATGLDSATQLDEALASVPGAAPLDVAPYGPRRAGLRALSFAGELFEALSAGLQPPVGGAIGAIGAPVLSRWSLRFDFPRRRLLLRRP
ncbi:MAG: hypothetical protein KA085_04700 [Phenylobacterium sp.]|uniref:hypothetical protein n=1 Tax=Phenylobacterium sp. TaxID=1871053 RepID=UPI001B71484D|nr:hypothetical protein [Phenylobacterium sp.]MBP7815400.1 hypothetical protein [Phenylobacterium sp.]MBP9230326.1 hypothetical protein [Phenylobacterium sp.]MBP9756437.1 hypothetical protein [Phenylobacterium sp.]